MKMIKKTITNGNKTKSAEVTASARIAEYVDDTVTEKGGDTSTVKAVVRVVGLRSGDTYTTFIKNLANRKTSTGSNGSFSIKLSTDAYDKYGEELKEALSYVHGHLDYIISEAYSKLPEEEKAKGESIAKQNYLRTKMIGLMGDLDYASDLVESLLTEKEELYIPNTAQLELTLVGGTQTFEAQNEGQGWRRGDYVFQDGRMVTCYRRNYEIFGRKRVPLVEQSQIEWAMDQVFELASSFEEAFKSVTDLSEEVIVRTYCNWASSLAHKDHKAVRVSLPDNVLKDLDAKAARYARELMEIK